MIYGLVLLNVCMLVTGQILWKIAVSSIQEWTIQSILSLIISPFFIGGAFLYVLATGLWLMILSKLPLSIAYPLQSISYVFGAVAAYFIFKETISTQQWVGITVIIFGVYLIAK
ncbi:EamA family transporter [Priestia abyssalis]|uniref:EamA family transporter n=1 Tax=Priestia abyssalis TaxID=1221450 RepID=UPI00195A12DE|nr:EamA family transporter [Priestia abyssalis]